MQVLRAVVFAVASLVLASSLSTAQDAYPEQAGAADRPVRGRPDPPT